MKKQIFALFLLMTGFGVSNLTAAKAKPEVTARRHDIDALDFWNKTIKLYKKEGYTDDSPEVRHSLASLRRVEARRAKKAGFFSRLMGKGPKKTTATAPREVESLKRKQVRTEREASKPKTTRRAALPTRTNTKETKKARTEKAKRTRMA